MLLYLKNVLNIKDIQRFSYRNDINGLRAIAVLVVILYHAEITFFDSGWLGVDIFFVISGFLISNIIFSELNNGTFKLKVFYLRRIRRILPALLSTILFTIPFAIYFLTPKSLLEFSSSVKSSILFYSNLYFRNLDFYNAAPTKVMPLLHTWSLAIEEQFYIIFPVMCLVLFKLNKNLISIGVFIFFCSSIYLNSTTSELVKFYEIQFRAWELLLGSLVMVARFKLNLKHTEVFGILLLIYTFIYFDNSMLTLNSIEPRLISNLGTALILFSDGKSIFSKILGNKYTNIIGTISYSLYLFHQPLFAFFRIFKYRFSINSSFIFEVLIFAILFIVSYLNWYLIEKVFQKTSLKVLLIYLIIILLIILIFLISSELSSGFSSRYDYVPPEVLYYSNNPNIYPNNYVQSDYVFKNKDCNNSIKNSNYCIWFNEKAGANIILIGDSHTNALSISFLQEFSLIEENYNLIFFSGRIGRCIISAQSDTVGFVEECSQDFFNEFIKILNPNEDIVIIFGRFDTWLKQKGIDEFKLDCNDCEANDIFFQRINLIESFSKKMYLIKPIPTYDFSIADNYLFKKTEWGTPIKQDINTWKRKIEEFEMLTKSNLSPKIIEIDTIPLFCDSQFCYASTYDKLLYSDSNHLTLDGSKIISNEIRRLILLEKDY